MAFTAETFQEFWAKPDLSTPSEALHDDVVGYWPGTDEPVRGRHEYVGALRELLDRIFFDRGQFERKLGKALDL
jgi:hypothetical protein